jgi:hypothetical protein
MVWSRVKTHGPHPSPRAGCSGTLCGTKWYIAGGASKKKRMSQALIWKMTWWFYFLIENRCISNDDHLSSFAISNKKSNSQDMLKPGLLMFYNLSGLFV